MPGHLFLALALGLVIGVVLGGRPRHLADHEMRAWWLLVVGLVLQVLLARVDLPAPFAFLLLSYACLLAFTAANLREMGMGVILIGIAMNALVITVNHGMPVREKAVEQAGGDVGRSFAGADGKHHAERPDSKLMPLGDIIPLEATHNVLSFGDLVISVALVDLVVHLMRPVRRRRPAARRPPRHRVIDLRDDVVVGRARARGAIDTRVPAGASAAQAEAP